MPTFVLRGQVYELMEDSPDIPDEVAREALAETTSYYWQTYIDFLVGRPSPGEAAVLTPSLWAQRASELMLGLVTLSARYPSCPFLHFATRFARFALIKH